MQEIIDKNNGADIKFLVVIKMKFGKSQDEKFDAKQSK